MQLNQISSLVDVAWPTTAKYLHLDLVGNEIASVCEIPGKSAFENEFDILIDRQHGSLLTVELIYNPITLANNIAWPGCLKSFEKVWIST